MEIFSLKPLLAILVSAAASLAILATRRSPNLRETWTFLAAGVKFLLIASLYPLVRDGATVVCPFFQVFPGVTSGLRVDALGLTFALLSSGLWILTSIYNVGYMRTMKEKNQTRYYFSFALSLAAAVGIAFSGDLLTFFIFYEMLTLATYPLVAHKESREAILAGRKYLVYSLSAGALMLIAIAWIYRTTGRLDFQAGGILDAASSTRALFFVFFFLIYGCGVKAALFPVHAWLPSAMVAPTPVSALLHAVAVVKAGVFGILRVTGFVFGPELLKQTGLGLTLACLAAFTILGASVIALAQENLKRRLAYSTISQLSYIILGAALLSPAAYQGAVLHLVNHAFMKITLFFCAGAIYACSHHENIRDLRGLGRQMPWTFAAFAVGAAGLSGFPPFNGFISKWFLCVGSLDAGRPLFMGVYLASALLNAAYLFPVVITAFLSANDHAHAVTEKPWTLISPPVITALLAVAFGALPFLFGPQIAFAARVSAAVFGGGR